MDAQREWCGKQSVADALRPLSPLRLNDSILSQTGVGG
jgi:hypothetical protein